MSIVFPDAELRTVSGQVLSIPDEILGYIDAKAKAQLGKDDTKKKDDGNKIFYDNFKNILTQYHLERAALNGVVSPNYSDTTLDDAARQSPGNLHYPSSPVWAKFQPKVIDVNNGNPTSNNPTHEVNTLPEITDAIDILKNGFADGLTDDTLTTAYVMGMDVEVDTGPFVIGDRVVIDQGGVSLLAEVTDVKPPTTTGWKDLELTVLAAAAGALPMGSRIRNFFEGFTNAQREGTSPNVYPEIFAYLKTQLDTQVNAWEGFLNTQKTALLANDAKGTEETQINAAEVDVQDALDAITTWEAAPATGAGVGRYGDTVLNPLDSARGVRVTEAPARVTQITTALGAATQAGDGTFSGTGNYLQLFNWIDIRINKTGGTLLQYYGFDLILQVFDLKIVQANTRKAEYEAQMSVKKVTVAPSGTVFLTLTDVTGLAISDNISVVDNNESNPVISAQIVGIVGLVVELDSSIPATYTLDNVVRLVKVL